MDTRIKKSIPVFSVMTVLVLFLAWIGFTYAAADPDSLKADKILFNGKIATVDSNFSIAQAVAIKGDKIVAVGKNADLEQLKGTRTQMIDLKGKTLIPGFSEGHMHMMTTGLGLSKVNLQDPRIKTMSDLVQAVGDRAKTTPKGAWIEGRGWDQSKLKENRFPTRWDLDEVSPDNPVFLMRTCAHIVVVNSKALELAGITKDTPQPTGGEIVKDEKGEPTGALLERPAFMLAQKLIPQPDLKKKKEGLKAACKALNAVGVTSLNEGGSYADDYQAYQELMNDGDLTVRVYAMPWLALHEISDEEAVSYVNHFGPRQGFGNDYLKIGALKIVMDGGIGGRTALMRTPYVTGNPGNYGIQSVPQDQLRKFIKLANQKGWQMSIHSCGGKAMDNVLEIFREADQEKPIKGRRWYFVHGYDPSPQNLADMKRMEVGVATNPSFIYSLGDSFIFNMGKEWAAHASPHKEYLENGIHISGGSDSPVSPFAPLLGIYAAVARKTQVSKEVAGADQRISVQEALRVFTMGGTWMTFEEKIKGSIEPGKLADMVILGEDILTVDPEQIPKIPIIATFVGGKAVYVAPGTEF
jgi:predicted amidohydrolase YtcJ